MYFNGVVARKVPKASGVVESIFAKPEKMLLSVVCWWFATDLHNTARKLIKRQF
jgi:hypothetical protein